MFAGGGAQYPGMGHELYETERVYRESVDECLDLLDPESRRALWTVLNGDRLSVELASQMERPSIGLPALLTCQVSMARLAASWGLNPTAMIGHSMGEYTAAQLAGVFSLRDALRLVQLRGQLFETVPKDGMLSVPLSPDELRDLLGSDLSIAAENAPQLCVASGPVEALRSLERKLEQQDIQCTRVRINIAAHSSMLDGILEEFRQFVASITLAPPTIPFVSNLTGDWIRDSEATDPEYWVRHLRNTVQFSAGVRLLTGDSTLALMEIGPGRTLATLARLNAPISQRSVAVTSMASADDASAGDRHAALLGMGELWCNGVRVDWTSLRSGDEPRRVPVPTYSFERSRHWIDAPVQSGEASTVEDESRRPVDEWFYVSEWERTIGPPAAESAGARLSVVLDDRSELGLALAEELRSKGDSVAFVRRAESFTQSEALDFTVNPLSSDDYVRLVESVLALAKGATVRFLYLWSGGASAGTQAEAEEQSFYSLVRLAQAWGREGSDANAELCLLSAGLWKIGGESAGDPSQALALGPMRVIPSEFSNLRTRAIDVGLPRASETTSHRLARQVSTELDRPDGGDIALRGGERWRRVFRRIALTDRTSGHESVGPIKHQGVYLITGGFGGIGALLAERLASQCAAKLILVGRHADGPVVDAIVSRCTALGSEVLPLAEDIAETEGAGRVVNEARRRFGHIDGVFHAAGVLDDGLMQLRTDEQSAAVLAPKVRGTIALDQALGDGDDGLLFVLFSSISAEAGLLGQADYAAASTFLDSYATARRESKAGLSVSVQWGTWVDVGMAARIANPGSHDLRESVAPLQHPLLTDRVEADDQSASFSGSLDCEKHWLVGQHRLRTGEALIPGTGYLELACGALAASRPTLAIEIRDVAFLSPFIVRDDEPRDLRVSLENHSGSTRFAVLGGGDQPGGEPWIEHASGVIEAVQPETEARVSVAEIQARCARRVGGPPALAAHPFLNLGARWNCIREVRYGEREAIGHLQLADDFRSEAEQYRLHPALLDMATACALQLIPEFDPAVDFYVPLSYTKLRSLAPMPAEVYSHVRVAESELDPREVAVLDVTIYSADGSLVADVEGFMMTRVADRSALTAGSAQRQRPSASALGRSKGRTPAARVPVLPSDGIRADEGIDALLRILEAEVPSNVTITWRHPAAVIEELHQLAAPSEPTPSEHTVARPTVVPEVELALVGHESVGECAAVARADRTGAVRVVAYVTFKEDQQATVSELRRFAKRLLDESVVPASFITLDSLPISAAGAVDHAALPDPYGTSEVQVAPRTETEKVVADTWKEVLGVDSVAVHDNFFDIGGHSLLAVRVVTRLDRKLGVRLSQAAMVLQTLEQLAAECERQRHEKAAVQAT